jgi:hypothetical protein
VRRLLGGFPQATVHAFEPQAREFGRLSETFAANPRVRLYPQALSDHSGRATLHSHEHSLHDLVASPAPASLRQGMAKVTRCAGVWSAVDRGGNARAGTGVAGGGSLTRPVSRITASKVRSADSRCPPLARAPSSGGEARGALMHLMVARGSRPGT